MTALDSGAYERNGLSAIVHAVTDQAPDGASAIANMRGNPTAGA
jgi:hypothetical protein